MGKPGPAPTPTGVLKGRGSWRAGDKRRSGEPRARGRPRCPGWLGTEAKKTFRRITAHLEDLGIIGTIDGNAIVRYCALWARWKDAEEFLTRNGSFYEYTDTAGNEVRKPYPHVHMAHQLSEHLLRIEAQFGMTPSARTRVEALPKDPGKRDDRKLRFFKNSD